jgi:hypothetical protein
MRCSPPPLHASSRDRSRQHRAFGFRDVLRRRGLGWRRDSFTVFE